MFPDRKRGESGRDGDLHVTGGEEVEDGMSTVGPMEDVFCSEVEWDMRRGR